ncbi:MAG: FAD-binding oxidoreductase [Parvularculaceae bacterium]
MTVAKSHLQSDYLAEILRRRIGDAHVRDDGETLDLFSHDIYGRAGVWPALIAAPASTIELADTVRIATGAGRSVIARGGGMSYTGGYLPTEHGAVVIDMRRMNRIIDINETDMTVTLETGATWSDLHAALSAKGLRTPFWGPLSGVSSTIGGGLSQNNAFFGAGVHGPASDSVVALAVVLTDGSILRTGSASTQGATPFFRHYGPDLTGLFLGDAGALGLKAEATLRLIEKPGAEGYASFAFKSREACAAAMSALARAGIGAEVFAFDPNLQRIRMKRASLAADVKALAGVVKGQKNLLAGVREAAKIAIAGRDIVEDDDYSVHLAVEGRAEAGVAADLAAARRIAAEAGGREIENTIPKVVRATPFTPLNAIIGPDGERWAPVHGIVPHSKAATVWREIDDYFASLKADFDREGVFTGYLLTTLSTNGFLIEPVFYWPSALDALHRETVEASMIARVKAYSENPAATTLVAKARRRVAEIFLAHGAAHFQIGKTYLYREGRSPEAWALLDSLKSALDPHRRLNPGALGLT